MQAALGASAPRSSIYWPVWVLVASLTFLQRFAVPAGGFEFPLALFTVQGALVWMLVRGDLAISGERAICLLVVLLLFVVSAYFSSLSPAAYGRPSYPSLGMFVVVMAPFVLVFARASEDAFATLLEVYSRVMWILALVGIAQFGLQFVGIRLHEIVWFFVPDAVFLGGFNYDIPLEYGAAQHKANGLFFLEPSFYSRALALGIIIEILYRKNVIRLAALHVALALTFSGTGLMALAVGYALILPRLSLPWIVAFVCISASTVVGFAMTEYAVYTTQRISEFSSPNTSAHVRFVAPYVNLVRFGLLENWWSGFGPGTGDEFGAARFAHGSLLFKSTFEYGLVPTIALLFFLGRCVLSSVAPLAIGVSLLLVYVFMAGGLVAVQTTYAILLFAAIVAPLRDPRTDPHAAWEPPSRAVPT